MPSSPLAPAVPAPPPSRRRAARSAADRAVIAFAVAIGVQFAGAPAMATTYKWVDQNGRVVYSDQPPPANIKSEIVKPPPPPANPNAAKELADKELEIRLREKKRLEDGQVAEKAAVDSERKRQNCAQARGQLQALQNRGQNFYRYNEKGERTVLDDASRRAAIEQQQQIIRDNCQG